MPVHDGTLVEAGVFHDLHTVWIGHLRTTLNAGLLPQGYYALAEQHAGQLIADVLTLHTGPAPASPGTLPPDTGGTAVAEAPPAVHRQLSVSRAARALRRTLAIRHVSGHRLVALLEIVAPANKDRDRHVAAFAAKVTDALDAGVHVLVVDLFPPSPNDPGGMHSAIRQRLDDSDDLEPPPARRPLTLASYTALDPVGVYLSHTAVGDVLPDMPLFLRPDRYVTVPLEATYQEAYRGLPAF